MVRGMCSRSTGRQYTTTCPASVSGVWSERFFARAARRCSPMPLCDALDCVHLHNEGSHQGLLSLRGPLVSSDIAGRIDPRVSFCLLVLTEKLCHFHTLLLFTCYDDSLSLWSSSPASQCHSQCGRLRLRVLFLTLLSGMARGSYPRF